MKADETLPACQLLRVKDVAEMLRLHVRTVWRLSGLAEAGLSDFPRPLRLGPKSVRWRMSDIECYVAHLAGEGN